MKTTPKLFVVPYMPLDRTLCDGTPGLDFWTILFNIEGQFSLEDYKIYFARRKT